MHSLTLPALLQVDDETEVVANKSVSCSDLLLFDIQSKVSLVLGGLGCLKVLFALLGFHNAGLLDLLLHFGHGPSVFCMGSEAQTPQRVLFPSWERHTDSGTT